MGLPKAWKALFISLTRSGLHLTSIRLAGAQALHYELQGIKSTLLGATGEVPVAGDEYHSCIALMFGNMVITNNLLLRTTGWENCNHQIAELYQLQEYILDA